MKSEPLLIDVAFVLIFSILCISHWSISNSTNGIHFNNEAVMQLSYKAALFIGVNPIFGIHFKNHQNLVLN